MRLSAGVSVLLIVLLGIAMRLIHLDGPPLDHHWLRQYDTAAIARNFAEPGSSILKPRVNWGGASPGYVESEFPLYQYATGLLYRIFGVHEAIPRLLSILCYVVTAVLLYLYGRDEYDRPSAVLAVVALTVLPLSWFFTRSIQPDAMALMASMAAILFTARWARDLRPLDLVLAGLGLTLAVLVKPTNLTLGLPVAAICVGRFGRRVFLRLELWALALVVLGCSAAWYWHAKELFREHGNTLYGAYPFPDLPSDPVDHTRSFLIRFFVLAATPFAFPLLGAGMLATRRDRGLVPFLWLASYLVPVYAIHDQFGGHDYYMLPLLLPASLFMGRGAWLLFEKGIAARGLLIATGLLVVLWSAHFYPRWFPDEAWHRNRVAFGAKIAKLTERGDRLVTVKRPNPERPDWWQRKMPDGTKLDFEPVDLYLADRDGWCIDTVMFTPEFVERLRGLGATHLSYFIAPRWPKAMDRPPEFVAVLKERYRLLYEGPDGALFDLREPPR